ncbi:hypothetical protein KM885_09375 [Oceanobacillus caeni]|uniref:DUF7878 domain-containing protein n=1 Tax=Oceanobacillus caeni TaxID=405946 RepID=UPI001C24A419|nr:hypothetical protein [Oceanobacillus caeni]MBU8790997.1 hypothetical protein [Oceanobacillus caeni]
MNTLKLKFELDSSSFIEPKLIKKRSGKLLVDIQGRLEVFLNDHCFFLEPSLALLEFGMALKNWRQEEDFHYYTIEHDEREGPILAFNKIEENYWTIYSIWQLYESKELLDLDRIIEAVDLFLLELDRELLKKYGFNMDEFITSKWIF